jgi:hypothetical protein
MVPVIIPITVGLAATPGNDKLRFDIGANGGMHFGLDCPVPNHSCGGFYGELHAEMNLYKRGSRNGFGFGLAAVGSQGGGLTAPSILFRFQWLRRNLNL